MRMTGAEALIECLRYEGVEVIFGYPGGAVLPIYDALYGAPLRHILTRHEQGAVHAADAYARATGRVGVCIATSGPGATNLVTGIANAYMDSIPLVIFTGQVATGAIGRDSFQEADITGITLPITKHNYLVKDVHDLPRAIKEAFYLARTGRPGPVLLDLPKDITLAKFNFSYPTTVDLPGYKPTLTGHPRQIAQAARALLEAECPVLYVGGGAVTAGAAAEIRELAERLGIPVTMTLMGLGVYPTTGPLSLGMLGMHGTAYANYAVTHCDLLCAVGARFDDRVTGKIETFAPAAKIIHIDIDPAEIGKNVRVDIPVVGDVKQVLRALLEKLTELETEEKEHPRWEKAAVKRAAWREQVAAWKEKYPLTFPDEGETIHPGFVLQEIAALTRGEAVITTEVGQNQMWAAQFLPVLTPRSFISSGGLGTMGFGLPAAIGAQVGRPDALVIDIAGDGSIQMNIQEMATAAANRLPVKVVILNNHFLGMVRQWQEFFHGRRYSSVCLYGNPDFLRLAEAYGWRGWQVVRREEVRPALAEAFAHPGPALVDIRIDPGANVFPMVPPNGALDKMMFSSLPAATPAPAPRKEGRR